MVDRILQRGCWEIDGAVLDVSLYEEEEHGSSIIVSGNFMGKLDEKALRMIFESEKRSAGGQIVDLIFRDKDALITFKDKEGNNYGMIDLSVCECFVLIIARRRCNNLPGGGNRYLYML